jgi:hypothetical protein
VGGGTIGADASDAACAADATDDVGLARSDAGEPGGDEPPRWCGDSGGRAASIDADVERAPMSMRPTDDDLWTERRLPSTADVDERRFLPRPKPEDPA